MERQFHLEPLAQHSSGEVMGHELVVDEAHDAVSTENPRKLVPQQHVSHHCLKPVMAKLQIGDGKRCDSQRCGGNL